MNLSNKNEALENVAKAILEGNTIEIEETLQEVNGDAYRWEDINNALMQAGFGPKVIIKVLMKLKGKKIKEGVEIDEATKIKAWTSAGRTANEYAELTQFAGPKDLEDKIGTRKMVQITIGKKYIELNMSDVDVLQKLLNKIK